MSTINPALTILLADDDEEDRAMTIDALRERRVANEIRCVTDGQELVDYLFRRGAYADGADAPMPGLILLDLNMPRKDGREALAEMKTDPTLRSIPVVVLTTSRAEEDIVRTYDLGVNSFISKPVTFNGLVQAMDVFSRYWLEIVELPLASETVEGDRAR
jgi:CheY-like chemotaxis protein